MSIDLEFTCPICGIDLVDEQSVKPALAFIDGQLDYICGGCFDKYFYTQIKVCSKCSRKIDFPRLQNYKMYCKICYDKQTFI